MDCLRSFTIGINQLRTFNTAGTNIKNWGVAPNYHWVIDQVGTSNYALQGYKRIDLYGMEMIGCVQTNLAALNGAIVTDYNFQIAYNGINPLTSGSVTGANFWGIDPNVQTHFLGKYTPKLMFDSPITGCQGIAFERFEAQGNNGETLNSIVLELKLTFKFYYKFDGE